VLSRWLSRTRTTQRSCLIRKLGRWRPLLFFGGAVRTWYGSEGFAKTRQGPGAILPKIHESGSIQHQEASILYCTLRSRRLGRGFDPGAIQPGTSPSLIWSKWELSLLHISSLKSRKSGDPIMQVQAPDSCHTAFAGVALPCPVVKRYGRILPGRTQGGVTNILVGPAKIPTKSRLHARFRMNTS
jgi:hypothetical protein